MSHHDIVKLSGNPIIDDARKAEAAAGVKMFLGIPDRWYEDTKWRCAKGHVSRMYLKSEIGGPRCLARGCGEGVNMTFPDDVEVVEHG